MNNLVQSILTSLKEIEIDLHAEITVENNDDTACAAHSPPHSHPRSHNLYISFS